MTTIYIFWFCAYVAAFSALLLIGALVCEVLDKWLLRRANFIDFKKRNGRA